MRSVILNSEDVNSVICGYKSMLRIPFRDQGVDSGSEKPPCKVGDTLYVRETWFHDRDGYQFRVNKDGHYFYDDGSTKWRSSVHMPEHAARLFLKVKNIMSERLQDISLSDMEKEGVFLQGCMFPDMEYMAKWNSRFSTRRLESLGWAANPLVWVIEFERCV